MSLQKLANFLSGPLEEDHEFDIEYFAKKASNNYISKKVPLNESIKKFASQNGFNQEQTKRICEAANHNVNQHLFNTQEDKNIYFDLADPDQMSDTPVKMASASEYSFTPREISSWGAEMEKSAELDTERASRWGEAGARLGGALGAGGALVGALAKPSLIDDHFHKLLFAPAMGTAAGYGLGRLGHRLVHGKAEGRDLDPRQFSEMEADEAYNHPDVQAAYAKAGRYDHQDVDDAFHRVLGQKKPYFNQFIGQNLRTPVDPSMDQKRIGNDVTFVSPKQAHIEVSALDPKLALLAVQEKVAASLQQVEDTLYMDTFRIKEARYKLYKEAKEVLKEEPYYKLAQAVAMSTDKGEILEDLTYELMEGGLVTEADMYAIVKTAGELEESHPVVQWTKKLAGILDSIETSSEAKETLQEQLATIKTALKE